MKLLLAFLALILLNNSPANAQRMPDVTGVALTQKVGASLPPESVFIDADGRDVRIGELFDHAPIVLVLGYFHCEKLCGVTRLTLLRAAQKAGLSAGSDYVFVAISIDPAESVEAAKGARDMDFAAASPTGTADGFRYLAGKADDIRETAEAVGFHYRDGARAQTFVHPIGAVVVTPSGVISSYLSAIGSAPEEMSAAIHAAAARKVAARVSPALLLCFDFDSATGRYTFAIIKFLRLGAIVMTFAIATIIYREFRKGARA